jgi:CoA-transferase family III
MSETPILEGVKVLDLCAYAVGPWAGTLLAQLGADVTRIDPPYGDPIRNVMPAKHGEPTTYMTANLGKRSAVLNLKDAGDLEIAKRLAAGADVVIENSRAGTMDRLGLGYDQLRLVNPRLIYCASSSFGDVGPLRTMGSTDPQGQAFSGFASLTGAPGTDAEVLRYALGAVAVHQRRHAATTPNAVMRARMTLKDYLASPYIAEPLRKLDYCLVNDGGVSLIVTTRDRGERLPSQPVRVDAIGRADANAEATALRPRLVDFYHGAHARAAGTAYAAAGVGPEDIRCVQIYDSFSIHVPVALEGFGYFPRGEADAFLRGDGLARLEVNTAGGHLSGSYMQGWGHQVEAVRRLRRQEGLHHVHYISDVAGKVTTVIYGKA